MPVNLDLLLLFIFGLILLAVMWRNKHKVEVQKIAFPLLYMILYRTKIGLKWMDRVARRYPKVLSFLGLFGVIIGFIGMVIGFFFILYVVVRFLISGAPTGFALLLPGVKVAEGLPELSFFHWIIAIFVLAGVHEFSHGLLSRLHNIKLKSSGFAALGVFLPIIPAAFVEPDEKIMKKRSKKVQLEILAAGSFSNFVTGGILLLIFLLLVAPFSNSLIDQDVLVINEVVNGSAAEDVGVLVEDELLAVNDVLVGDGENFLDLISSIEPGDNIELKTNTTVYSLVAKENPDNESKGYIGTNFRTKVEDDAIDTYGKWGVKAIFWIYLLFFWLVMTNFGVGVVNLLPLGPIDGGRMFYLAALYFLGNEKKAKKVWVYVGVFTLLMVIIALSAQIIKFISFVFNGLLSLIL